MEETREDTLGGAYPHLGERYRKCVADYPEMYWGNKTFLRCVAELVRLAERHSAGAEVRRDEFLLIAKDVMDLLMENAFYNPLDKECEFVLKFGKVPEEAFREVVRTGDFSVLDRYEPPPFEGIAHDFYKRGDAE